MSIFRHLDPNHRRPDPPAKRGRKFTFHGAYATKAEAIEKERATPGAFVEERTIRGSRRYVVLTPNK